jgi:aminopeptidase YwaD
MPYRYTDLIRRAYRGDMAHRHMTAISGHHRIQASPGYRAAAEYVADQLEAAGLEVRVRRYPADGAAWFWNTPSFLEWACESASLQLLTEGGPQTLCDFASVPTSLVQRSIPVEGEFEVVAPGGKGGLTPADYAGLDVAGKVVLTNKRPVLVAAVAIRQLGAAGILFDGMEAGGRTELDVPDGRQYTSFWWAGKTGQDAWGFVLSPRQGRGLRASLARGQTVRVAAAVDSRFYPGSFEVVDAAIPGADPAAGEILLVSHLCHPRPGAHDNGSGAGALIETAASLARLIADGSLPAPRRGIRFLWPPEMTGTFAFLAEHEDEMKDGRWIAGLNLDMVGADQVQTGSVWEFVDLPLASASFSDHLLSWLREPFLDGMRHRETPFSAGSDHYILSDPTVGIPSPMIIQWPDRFYHTSEDTPDKVSPDTLARSGALAAAYAYWLATAGAADAQWLAHLMVARIATQAAAQAGAAAEALADSHSAAERRDVWTRYSRAAAFRAERSAAALGQLTRLDPHAESWLPEARADATAALERERAWVAARAGEDAQTPEAGPEPWRAEATGLIPGRNMPGPIDVEMAMQALHPELLPEHWAFWEQAGHAFADTAPLVQYWIDGQRTIADICDLTSVEVGREVGELCLAYLKLLGKAGLIELEPAATRAPAAG